MQYNSNDRSIDTTSYLRTRSKAFMSMSPKRLFDLNNNIKTNPIRSSYKSNISVYSPKYQLTSYINNGDSSNKLIKPSYTTISSPNRIKAANTSLIYKYGNQALNESTNLISTENSHVIAANQILNRTNCDLKAQVMNLKQELDSYKESIAEVNELKELIDYLNSKLSHSNQQNKELSLVYESIDMNANQIKEENSKLKETIDELNQKNQMSFKANEELKSNYKDIKEQFESNTDKVNIVLREKDKIITQLTNVINDLTEKNENMNKTIKDYNELNMTMKKSIDILSQKNSVRSLKDSLQAKEDQINNAKDRIESVIEENKRIAKECCEKDIIIGVNQREIEEMNKLSVVIDKLKEDQVVYTQKISSLYGIIANRDNTIEELKSSYNTLNNALMKITDREDNQSTEHYHYRNANTNEDNKYKAKYELELKKNEQLVITLEESKNISKSLMDSREQLKNNYEEIIDKMQQTLKEISTKYSNIEEVFKENEELRAQNEFLMKQIKQMPMTINDINLLKTKNKIGTDEETMLNQEKNVNQEGIKEIQDVTESKTSNNTYALYNICKKKLIGYHFNSKTFKIANPQNLNLFMNNYQEEGSITYNTLEGLFVLTGPNFDMVYYFSQKKNSISQILKLNNNHCNGSIVMDDSTQSLIFLSGNSNALVEQFDFKKAQLSVLPSMLQARANASFCFINRRLYAFFGYNYNSNQITNTIEYFDFEIGKMWEQVIYTSKDNCNFSCAYHLVINIGKSEVLLLGGIKANEEKFNQKIITMNMDEKTIEETETDLPSIQENKFYLFDSNSQYNLMLTDSNSFRMVAMDNMNNVHVIDSELKYEVIVFAQGIA